ncbi:hypothetical protein ABZP36_010992 [Zizania latifolia]
MSPFLPTRPVSFTPPLLRAATPFPSLAGSPPWARRTTLTSPEAESFTAPPARPRCAVSPRDPRPRA